MFSPETMKVGDLLFIRCGPNVMFPTRVVRILKRYFETSSKNKWTYTGDPYPRDVWSTRFIVTATEELRSKYLTQRRVGALEGWLKTKAFTAEQIDRLYAEACGLLNEEIKDLE